MATAALIPVSEYLSNVYGPDCDYADGELRGAKCRCLAAWIVTRYSLRNLSCEPPHLARVVDLPEPRVQVNARRYRVPDVCVLRDTDPADDIVQKALLICH